MRPTVSVVAFLCVAITLGAGAAAPRPAGLGTIAGQVLGVDGKAVAAKVRHHEELLRKLNRPPTKRTR